MSASLVSVDCKTGILRRYERVAGNKARLTNEGGVNGWPLVGRSNIVPATVESFRVNPCDTTSVKGALLIFPSDAPSDVA